jgi:hypothetical protein
MSQNIPQFNRQELENIPQLNRQELENILKILPKVCYEVNCDQTIYSLKLNGKPFFMDNRFLNFEDNSQEIDIECERMENCNMISIESQELGEKFAEKNRLVFMSLKGIERDQRKRLTDELKKTGHKKEGKSWVSKNGVNPEIYLNRRKLIPQNGIYDDPKQVPPKEDKWDKSLVRRKLYTKSELMIRFLNMKETKFILNKCKESLFEKKNRKQRREKVKTDANVKPVVGCDLLHQTLYSINESEESL